MLHGDQTARRGRTATGRRVESGAARLAEAANAPMIPEREGAAASNGYVMKLADGADRPARRQARDIKSVSEASDTLDGICASCHRHYQVE